MGEQTVLHAEPYVVVGASGILAPVADLVGGRHPTIGISRGQRELPGSWTRSMAMDAREEAQVEALAAVVRAAAGVIAYEPAVTPASWAVLARLAPRAVILLPSRYARPGAEPDEVTQWRCESHVTTVVLGWTGPETATRWHSPEEVSAGALRALNAPPGAVVTLGRLTPWTARPA